MFNSNTHPRTYKSLIATGLLLILLGVLSICAPFIAGVGAETVVAVLVLVGGATHLVLAFEVRGFGGFIRQILLAIFYGCAGLFMLFFPVAGLVVLTAALLSYIVAVGLTELTSYFALRSARGSGWLLVCAIVTLGLAALTLVHFITSTIWLVGTLVGVSMLSSGISRTSLGFGLMQSSR